MAVRLTIRKGAQPGKSVEVQDGQITIGRDDRCDLTIVDWKVSRKHALLEIDPNGRAVLRDLKSSNGTFVNGNRVSTTTLTGGEELRFGDTVVVSSAIDAPSDDGGAAPMGARPPAGPATEVAPRVSNHAPAAAPAPESPSTIQRLVIQRSLRRVTVLGVALLLAVIAVGAMLAAGVFTGGGSATSVSPAQVIANVAPSTVLVVADDGDGSANRGSGWVWNAAQGLIVTNAHVTVGGDYFTVASGETMTIRPDSQGRIVAGAGARRATLRGQSLCEDIAVLQIPNTSGLKTMPRLVSQAQLKIGDPVIAVGYPATFNLLQNPDFGANLTGDAGLVSQPQTTFPAIPGDNGGPATGPYHDVILTDTPINPGNSGGPLVDYQSRLVGMNTAERTGVQGQNYAIGVDRIDQIVPQLLTGRNVCG